MLEDYNQFRTPPLRLKAERMGGSGILCKPLIRAPLPEPFRSVRRLSPIPEPPSSVKVRTGSGVRNVIRTVDVGVVIWALEK
jgi:hypothetical protein